MQWEKKRKQYPKHGELRRKDVFVWWPKEFDTWTGKKVIWLEWVTIQEVYLCDSLYNLGSYTARTAKGIWYFDRLIDQRGE